MNELCMPTLPDNVAKLTTRPNDNLRRLVGLSHSGGQLRCTSVLVPCVDGLGSFFRVVVRIPPSTDSSILLSAQARQGRVEDFRRRNHESRCSPMGEHFQFWIPMSGVRFPPVALLHFFGFSSLLFAFRREVAHLTWPRSFRAVGEYSNSPLFSPFGFFILTKFFSMRGIFSNRVFLAH